jgi:predicted nucleotidyltransferase
MRNILINITKDIDTNTKKCLIEFDEVAKALGIEYMLVGATARDLVLHYVYGAKIERATNDVDMAIHVESWEVFEKIKSYLLGKGYTKTKTEHRLNTTQGTPLDIVPFGGVEIGDSKIAWPPNQDFEMNVLGFSEARENALLVVISEEPVVQVPVVSPAGMSILKLIAWTDRESFIRKKDATDFLYLLNEYEIIPSVQDEIYADDLLLDKYGGDLELSASYILGRHAGAITKQNTYKFLDKLFNEKISSKTLDRFISDSIEKSQDFKYDRNQKLGHPSKE